MLVHHCAQGLAAQVFGDLRRGQGKDVGAATLLGGNDAGFVQQAVGSGDGVEVNPQILCQPSDGGELVAGFQVAIEDFLADVFNNLCVYGYSGTEIKI